MASHCPNKTSPYTPPPPPLAPSHLPTALPSRTLTGVGDHSSKSKQFYASPRSIYGETSNEWGECIFIPLKIAKRKCYKNAVGGVVLVAIQIAAGSDLSAEQKRLHVQHTYNPVTSPTP